MTEARQAHPGECLQCFFRLKAAASPTSFAALAPIQTWLESHLEVEVNASDAFVGTMPVFLDAPDLEAFCHRTMQRVREDRAETAPEVYLALRFREDAA